MKLSFQSIVSISFLLILTVGAYAYFEKSEDLSGQSSTSTIQTSTSLYECNGDGKICPDGSIVGRTGEMCEFSSCPGAFPTTTTSHGMAILYGRITVAPTCPVENQSFECDPKPYVAEVTAYDKAGRDMGVGTRTTSQGTFIMDLLPGEYILRVANGRPYPSCPDTAVSVAGNASSTIAIVCDSGIR